MSESPIIQNGMLVRALNHVVSDNPTGIAKMNRQLISCDAGENLSALHVILF